MNTLWDAEARLACFFFACLCAAALGLGLFQGRRRVQRLRRLVCVEAWILSSELDDAWNAKLDAEGLVIEKEWEPRFLFSYEFDGRRYESRRIRDGRGTRVYLTRAEGLAAQRRYPRGATVDAWVDPHRPAEGFLVRDDGWLWFAAFVVVQSFVIAAVTTLLLIVGIVLWSFATR